MSRQPLFRAALRTFCLASSLILAASLLLHSSANGQTTVQVESSSESTHFEFDKISPPAVNDLGQSVKWAVARGQKDGNSAPLSVVHDGKIPSSDDSPRESFFFAPNTNNGSITVDLGSDVALKEVVTYSWHTRERAPQVYTLYGARAADVSSTFTWDKLADGVNPADAGWSEIAKVDTRRRRNVGGQHAGRIATEEGEIGSYRYLLFAIERTEKESPFAQTFFSEIDLIATDAPAVERLAVPERTVIRFATADEKYTFTIDTTVAPELHSWAEEKLKPVMIEWYPKIVDMLPSDGYEAQREVPIRFLPGSQMEGIPAYVLAGRMSLNTSWYLRERDREGLGAAVHELVHIVQSYQSFRGQGTARTQPPGWLVEGIPDYIRWFLYEPESKGAVYSKDFLSKAKHDASYRVTGNFIDWVIRNHDSDGTFLEKLNAVCREGRYTSDVWKKLTGKSEEELAEAWKNQ